MHVKEDPWGGMTEGAIGGKLIVKISSNRLVKDALLAIFVALAGEGADAANAVIAPGEEDMFVAYSITLEDPWDRIMNKIKVLPGS